MKKKYEQPQTGMYYLSVQSSLLLPASNGCTTDEALSRRRHGRGRTSQWDDEEWDNNDRNDGMADVEEW